MTDAARRLDLHPMSLGEILDRTFQIYRSRFAVFLGIAALPVLVMTAIHLAEFHWLHLTSLIPISNRAEVIFWNALIALGYYHISGLIAPTMYPAAIQQSSDAVMGSRRSFLSSLRFVAGRWQSYLWISVLKLAAQLMAPETVVFGSVILFSLILDATHAAPNFLESSLVLFPLALCGVLAFLWLGACFSMAIPAAALEQLKGFRALRRSWNLSRGTRLRITVFWVALYLLVIMLGAAAQLLLRMILNPFYTQAHNLAWRGLYIGSSYGVRAALSALISPIYPIAITLFYYDQRIRKEGYDIERMMQAAGLEAPAAEPAASVDARGNIQPNAAPGGTA